LVFFYIIVHEQLYQLAGGELVQKGSKIKNIKVVSPSLTDTKDCPSTVHNAQYIYDYESMMLGTFLIEIGNLGRVMPLLKSRRMGK